MFEQIIERLEGVIGTLEDPTHLEKLADDFAIRLRVTVPKSSGRMAITLSEVSISVKSPEGWIIGIGNPELVGFDDEKPPPHTISDFLKAFPRFRQPSLFEGRTPSKSLAKQAKKFGLSKVFLSSATAWKLLSERAKEQLQFERRAGRFGGQNAAGVGRTPYLYPQEGSEESWAESAAQAGISPKRFIQRELDAYKPEIAAYVSSLWLR